MDTRLHLQPGQNGAKALVRKYGERLVCGRYRYDAETRQRHKTVELIEETVPWSPQGSREAYLMQRAPNESVLVKTAFDECGLREQVRRAGGYWQPEEQAWRLPYGAASRLGSLARNSGRYIDMDGYISSIRYMSSNWRCTTKLAREISFS